MFDIATLNDVFILELKIRPFYLFLVMLQFFMLLIWMVKS